MNPRFYCPQIPAGDGEVELPEQAAHHASKVLRLKHGHAVVLFDGAGGEVAGRLLLEGRSVRVALGSHTACDREAPLSVALVQGLAVADKMDWIVQKAVELGARALVPIAAERSVLRLEGERAAKRVGHWQQVVVSASEQCGRNRLMEIAAISRLDRWLADSAGTARWILAPQGGVPLSKLDKPTTPVSILIGPEGGWSPNELAAARAAGCEAVSLGPRVMRTETAGLAALAAMMALWGDF